MFTDMTAGWMILIGLIVAVVLVLGRTHRRADADAWTPAQADDDADRRRLGQELRMSRALTAAATLRRVGSELNQAARFDRGRAELLEPDDHRLAA